MQRALALVLLVSLARASGAQSTRASLDSLADRVRVTASRYADRRVALAEGYRRLGADFPGMGEHWVHGTSLMRGTIDADRPTILSYATVEGRPTLIAAGFVVTSEGNAPPRDAPGWPAQWHEHSGLLSEESGSRVRRTGDAAHAGHADASRTGTRVWVLHIWTALRNPHGPYAADNWALPYVRLGLRIPDAIDTDAARALSLLSGGDDHYTRVLLDAGIVRTEREAEVRALFGVAVRETRALADRLRAGAVASATADEGLTQIWRTLVRDLQASLGADAALLLAPAHTRER